MKLSVINDYYYCGDCGQNKCLKKKRKTTFVFFYLFIFKHTHTHIQTEMHITE